MNYYEFQTIQIQRIAKGHACAWWFGDWLGIGAKKFGKKKSMQALIDAGLVRDRKRKGADIKQPNIDHLTTGDSDGN